LFCVVTDALLVNGVEMAVFWDVAVCNVTDIDRLSEELTASIIRAVSICQTAGCNAPEGSFLIAAAKTSSLTLKQKV
jgi:hypothetical protein